MLYSHRRDGGSAASNEYYLKGCELRILCCSITTSGSKRSFLHDEICVSVKNKV